jgi:hypothetical protein
MNMRNDGAGGATEKNEFGVATVWLIGRRVLRSGTLWLVLLLGAAATAVILTEVRPIYRSEAVLFYRQAAGASFVTTVEGDPSRRLAARLKEMLFTRERLTALIQEFNLYPELTGRQRIVEAVDDMRRKRIKFESSAGDTFRISFDSELPAEARGVVTRAVQMLLEVHRMSRSQDVVSAKQFFDSQRHDAEGVLHQREREYADFLAQHPQLATATGPGPVSADAPLRAATATPAEGGKNPLVARLEQQIAQLRRDPSDTRPRHGSGERVDPALLAEREAAQTDLIAARRDLAVKQKQFTNEYPDVREANAAVSAARERLRRIDEAIASAKRQVALADAEAAVSAAVSEQSQDPTVRKRVAALEKQISLARSKTKRDPRQLMELGTRLAELDRRVTEARDRLAVIQNKQFQASLQATLESQDAQGELVVVDPAFLPVQPERRGRLKIAAAGAAGSLCLALSLSLGVVFMSDRLRTRFDMGRLALPLVLVEVPRARRWVRSSNPSRRSS